MEDVKTIILKNGMSYSVRSNRDRFFYPNEWMKFYDALPRKKQQISFDVFLNTGARINEARHIKVGDIDFERNTIILRVTKVKARKGERNPRPRTISISTQFARRLKSYINERKLTNDDYLGLLSTPAANICMKKTLGQVEIKIMKKGQLINKFVSQKRADELVKLNKAKIVKPAIVKDYYMFSVHNIRKTHGNWLKALGVEGAEICLRLGHDMNTYLKAYGSPDIFNYKDIEQMRMILGDLYANFRRGR